MEGRWTFTTPTARALSESPRAPTTPRSAIRRPTPRRCCGWRAQCHDDGVALAIFPELTLSGYSIEDIVLQDVLLDDVEAAVLEIVAASTDLLPVLVVGAPLRYRHRIYNTAVVIHRGAVLGVAPKSYLPTYREFYERRQIAPGDDERGTIRIGEIEAPVRPGPVVRGVRSARLRAARRNLRGHVRADSAQR